MLRSAACSTVIALMLYCGVEVLGGDALAVSPTLVELEGASQPLGSLQQRLARERGEVPKDIPGERLRGFLAKPDGNGPFPAVVALHGCDGLHEAGCRALLSVLCRGATSSYSSTATRFAELITRARLRNTTRNRTSSSSARSTPRARSCSWRASRSLMRAAWPWSAHRKEVR
jgi:hypothetical protein